MASRKLFTLMIFLATSIFFAGCAQEPTYVSNDGIKKATTTMGIDNDDFVQAAADAIDSMLRSPKISRQTDPYVLMIGEVINDTTQRIDTDRLIKKIRIELLNSDKFIVTTAIRAGGAEDKMVYETRKLRENSEFNQKTVAKEGQLLSAKFSLSGKIIEDKRRSNGKQYVEYIFQLTMTNLDNGLAYWEGETVIKKVGSNKSVTW